MNELNSVIRDITYRILESLGLILMLIIKTALYAIVISVAAFIAVHSFLFIMSYYHPGLILK